MNPMNLLEQELRAEKKRYAILDKMLVDLIKQTRIDIQTKPEQKDYHEGQLFAFLLIQMYLERTKKG